MSTTAVGSVTSAQSTASDRGMDSLRSEDFFKILVTEMQNQDPFQPSETSDMISQVSQIRSIELSQSLTDTLAELSDRQRTAGIADMLGKFVGAKQTLEDGTEMLVSGIVTGVQVDSNGSAILELDTGQTVLAENVSYIAPPEAAEALAAAEDEDKSADQAKGRQRTAGVQAQPGPLDWLNNLLSPWLPKPQPTNVTSTTAAPATTK